jgi:hypothetical protein
VVRLSDKHFELLGVDKNSTREEIKKAYWKQMNLWHSDKHQTEPDKIFEYEERAKKINEAYSLLKDYISPSRKNYSDSTVKNKSDENTPLYNLNIKVQSSNLYSVNYDNINMTLKIQFKDKSIYHYFKVPAKIFIDLLEASSKGKFAIQYIYYKYQYKKMK